MRYRTFPGTDIRASEVGFGTWTISTGWWGEKSDDEAAALLRRALDVEEGADALIVKPALPYLDVLRAVRERFEVPVGAYNVSGEYAMLKAAAAQGLLDERAAVLETLTSIRRAASRQP